MNLLDLDPYPFLDGDDLLWNLVLKQELMIAQPFGDYLEQIVDKLDCRDVEVKRNKIFFTRLEKDEFNVEITYSDQGTFSKLGIFDDGDDIIYEIIRDDSNFMILIAVGIFSSFVATILVVLIIKRKKKFKLKI